MSDRPDDGADSPAFTRRTGPSTSTTRAGSAHRPDRSLVAVNLITGVRLGNNATEVVRRVEAGETPVVTVARRPVAELRPLPVPMLDAAERSDSGCTCYGDGEGLVKSTTGEW